MSIERITHYVGEPCKLKQIPYFVETYCNKCNKLGKITHEDDLVQRCRKYLDSVRRSNA